MKPSQKQVVLVWQSLSLTTSNHKKDLALNFQLSQNIHVEDETRANSENQCNLMKKNADGRCAALAKKGDATGKKSQYEITMQGGIIIFDAHYTVVEKSTKKESF